MTMIIRRYEGKSILLIGSIFYGYCQKVVSNLKERGAEVDYVETDKRKRWLEYLERFGFKSISNKIWDRIVLKQLQYLNKNYDYILIVKGKHLSKSHFHYLKERYKNAHRVVYLWDSIKNVPNWGDLSVFGDDIYTFDRLDAFHYNIHFRPLFFTECNDKIGPQKYQLSFVGGFHSDRYEIVRSIKDQMKELGLSYRFVFYLNRFYYLYYRFINHRIRKCDDDIIVTTQLPYKDYIQISLDSVVVLDINHPSQSGLTMRTIESLGLSRKVLTTNSDILSYSMIDSTQVSVIDRQKPVINVGFINSICSYSTDKAYFTIGAFIDELLANGTNK